MDSQPVTVLVLMALTVQQERWGAKRSVALHVAMTMASAGKRGGQALKLVWGTIKGASLMRVI